MLSSQTNRTPRRPLLLFGVLLAGIVLVSADRPVRAEEVKTDTALSLVPADTAVFGTMLRNKEQFDLFYKSNAYKAIRSLPIVKDGYKMLMAHLSKEGQSPLEMYKKFLEIKENKELLEVLTEAVSDEVFVYMGKTWADTVKVMLKVNEGQTLGTYRALLEGENPNRGQMRGILLALQQNREMVKVPELVFGFKLKETKKTDAQLKRLEKLVADLIENIPPLKGKFKRTMIGGNSFLTMNLDAESLVPWDDVNLREFEDKKDEFEDLLKHARKQTLTISVGVQGKYLLLGITSSPKDMEQIGGKGKSLAEREELQPLAKFASRRLTGISYTSKELMGSAAGYQGSLDSYVKLAKDALKKADLRDERRKAIEKDLDDLLNKMKKVDQPTAGASVAFSFLTDTGYEGYSYSYGKYDHLKDVQCKLHNYFGGDPIFAGAFACKVDGSAYRELVSTVKKAYGHFEAIFMDMNPPQEVKDQYNAVTRVIFPLLRRLDDTTSKLLIPSVKDTGLGLVLDAKWSSKQWQKEIPAMPKEMPMLEVGLLWGISDAKQFTQAMKTYRTTLNEIWEQVRGLAPPGENIPEFKIPTPESEVVKDGTLYYWPLPEEAGLDKQVQPVFGIGKEVGVIALSKKHGTRLLTATPLKAKFAPLARKGNLIGVTVLNWPALVDAAAPWVEFSIGAASTGEAKDPKATKAKMSEILKQVKVGLEVLKAYKGSASVAYLEDGKLVTHTQLVIKDIEKSTEPE